MSAAGMTRGFGLVTVAVTLLLGSPVVAGAQAAPPSAQGLAVQRISFQAAIEQALARNPAIEQAASGIVRAEGLLQQTRALMLPSLAATLTTSTIGPVTEFAGESIVPRTQVNMGAAVSVPLLAPVRWAQRTQAGDQVLVSRRGAEDTRRQVAVATAEAYLAVIAARQLLELNERARENARAHYEFADERFRGGLGSKLNALRAQQELSSDEGRVEEARLAVRRAQEALGVLVAADRPLDAAEEPAFDVTGATEAAEAGADPAALAARPDLRLLTAREAAATRVVNDSWREYLPEASAVVAPQWITPTGLFAQSRSWSASILFAVPLFDAGERRGRAAERRGLLQLARAERLELERQAVSEVRTAREAVAASERALARARAAAEQANEVMTITDIAFREGATTNIEVLDAQRRARDAETAAAIVEHQLRRARLELLVALGKFPG
ncbi:MAG: TolC family protein [Acidobacteria bacterium]|nr:MAG: TolC family protein [Acidobacteriota bacterium]